MLFNLPSPEESIEQEQYGAFSAPSR